MTSSISYSDEIATIIRFQRNHAKLIGAHSMQKAQGQLKRIYDIMDVLIDDKRYGRPALETLLHHEDAYVRLRAGEAVILWNPEKAIPVLGRLLVDDLGPDRTPMELIDIATDAKDQLYMHYGLRHYDRNDLIEPLRAYGIEIPRLPRP